MRRISILSLFFVLLFLVTRVVRGDGGGGGEIAIVPEADIITPEGFDPYNVLKVEHSASRAEIKKAYKALKSGSKGGGGDDVELAFTILGNGDKRSVWDAKHNIDHSGEEL